MTVWVVSADGEGSYESAHFYRNAFSIPLGVEQSLADFASRDDLQARLAQLPRYGDATASRLAAAAAQLWSFASDIQPGDTLLIPHQVHKVSVGVVNGGYIFLPNRGGHSREMTWRARNMPRYRLGPDLLYTISRMASVFAIRADGFAERIEQFLTEYHNGVATETAEPIYPNTGFPPDWEQYTRDGVAHSILLNFKGRRLVDLVSGLLRASGYNALETEFAGHNRTLFARITAGKGQWGFAKPELTAHIKMSDDGTNRTDWGRVSGPDGHALLISLDEGDGQMSPFAAQQRWGPYELAELTIRRYDNLPDDIRRDIPLRARRILIETDQRL